MIIEMISLSLPFAIIRQLILGRYSISPTNNNKYHECDSQQGMKNEVYSLIFTLKTSISIPTSNYSNSNGSIIKSLNEVKAEYKEMKRLIISII